METFGWAFVVSGSWMILGVVVMVLAGLRDDLPDWDDMSGWQKLMFGVLLGPLGIGIALLVDLFWWLGKRSA